MIDIGPNLLQAIGYTAGALAFGVFCWTFFRS